MKREKVDLQAATLVEARVWRCSASLRRRRASILQMRFYSETPGGDTQKVLGGIID